MFGNSENIHIIEAKQSKLTTTKICICNWKAEIIFFSCVFRNENERMNQINKSTY